MTYVYLIYRLGMAGVGNPVTWACRLHHVRLSPIRAAAATPLEDRLGSGRKFGTSRAKWRESSGASARLMGTPSLTVDLTPCLHK